jgi:hypothetical protein
MSIFDRLDRVASRAIYRTNAIPFRLTPMRAGTNGRPRPDEARPVIEGRGVLDMAPGPVPIEHGRRSTSGGSNALRSLIAGEEPSLSIDRRHFGDVSREPRQSDMIEFPTRPDLPRFEVVAAERDGLSRMIVRLVKVS